MRNDALTAAIEEDYTKADLPDRERCIVCQVTAYYNYVNRLADGLGVELEDWMP